MAHEDELNCPRSNLERGEVHQEVKSQLIYTINSLILVSVETVSPNPEHKREQLPLELKLDMLRIKKGDTTSCGGQ